MIYKDQGTGLVTAQLDTKTYSFGAGRSGNQTNGYLRGYDGAPMNLNQFVVPFDIVITSISATCQVALNEWRIEIRNNLNPLFLYSQVVPNISVSLTIDTLQIVIAKDTPLSLYLTKGIAGNGLGANIPNPRVEIFYRRKF